MTVIITGIDEYLCTSNEKPEVGKTYTLEDATEGTQAQNKAFHALVQEFWTSGAHSYSCRLFSQFRDFIKKDIGAGFESYVYADENGIHKAKTLEEIPSGIPITHKMGKLKSWADYTKKERRETMDRLISTMIQAGVNSKKFSEILSGMNNN